jgi:outer membrane protein assembly factor BamB
VLLPTLALSLTLAAPQEAPTLESEWPRWRGPLDTGVAPHGDPPVRWSETENVRWKTALPGLGHSSPVVAGGRVFLTTAVPWGEPFEARIDAAEGVHDSLPVTRAQRFVALAVDLADGKVLWETVLREAIPHEGGHYTGSYASASPATDGAVVIASFGSEGLYGLDVNGDVLWRVETEPLATKHNHGEGSSPALFDGTVVLLEDHEGQSRVRALDARTGEERWRHARDEPTSWTSPIVAVVDGKPQAIVSGSTAIRGYDLADGTVLWECGGLSRNVVCTPVFAEGLLHAGSSYEKQALLGLDLAGARGDLAPTEHVLWVRRKATPYVPSLLRTADALYFLHHYQGRLSRVDPRTGAESGRPTRLAGMDDIYASPVAAAGRVYVTDRGGVTAVLSDETSPRILARNTLADRFSASAALVGKALLLRGERFLYCLSEPVIRDDQGD